MSLLKPLTLALSLAIAAPAAADEAVSPALLRVLNSIDEVPTKAALVALGAGDGAPLVKVAEDEALPRYPRARAAGLLGLFESELAGAALVRLSEGASDLEVQIQAIAARADREGERALAWLRPLTASKNPELQGAAIRAVSRLPAPIAVPELRRIEASAPLTPAARHLLARRVRHLVATARL